MRSPIVGYSVSVKHAKDAGLYVINIIFVFVAVFQRWMLMEIRPRSNFRYYKSTEKVTKWYN